MSDNFIHLHVHTQYSILDGASKIETLISKAKANNMPAVAITDHGNMFGVLNFVTEAEKQGIKPIIGCETYVAHNTHLDKKAKEDRAGYHLILLAKNLTGYKNLSKLITIAFKDGTYYKPRIDKKLLRQYREGLIACSACLKGEVAYSIIHYGMDKAVKALEEYIDIFGEDFYLEMMRHGNKDQDIVNLELLKLSEQYKVKLIATNDVHFVNKEDAEAHNILICINTQKELEDENRLSYSGNEYFKTYDEMKELFADVPDAITNTFDIYNKIEKFDIKTKNVILPVFDIPKEFSNEDEYLLHLCYEGAKEKYGEITQQVKERLDYELAVIKRMGFSGYFLIVRDFVSKAKEMGVLVGPGRGSAVGSIISYCLNIITIDPIQYNLLFERFMNPDRISMPDIDIDFDDEGRMKVLDYVCNKYGREKVAQIITFGKLGPKMAIKDVARVLKMPNDEANALTKLIPEKASIKFDEAYAESPDLRFQRDFGSPLVKKVLSFAEVLEGSVRNVGTHACGVIIGPEDLMNYVPLTTAKDTDFLVSQYDGKLIEKVGLLKMDFLGIKTLSIIKDTLNNIKKRHNIDIDLEKISYDDPKTFQLFQKGDTVGIFQFESEGMRTFMRSLKPSEMEDLIALNALYRPGPMSYIPKYISRKHKQEKVEYQHPLLETILNNTYGIMIYQEQIMKISQVLGNFTGSEADELRKAMGKKVIYIIENAKNKFIEGAMSNDIPEPVAKKIYEDMAEFGKYGFNRSHSVAYAVVAYKTAYLKANYPVEFISAVLTHNITNLKDLNVYLDEAKKQGITVLGPDINESALKFFPNAKGEIRFGLAGIKNVGEVVVNDIVSEREANGRFKNIFDLVQRVNPKSINKKSLESLAMAGAFDCFEGTHRAQYFFKENSSDENAEQNFIEKIVRFASNFHNQKAANQQSLFGEIAEAELPVIELPDSPKWTKMQMLKNEKEVVGMYLSGHPLDAYKIEINSFCNIKIEAFINGSDLVALKGRDLIFAGLLAAHTPKKTKTGSAYGNIVIEDYTDSLTLNMFSEDYSKFKEILKPGSMFLFKAAAQLRRGSESQYELKITGVSPLEDVIEKLTYGIYLYIPLILVEETLISDLAALCEKNKGSCKLTIYIIDEAENLYIDLPSKKYKVSPKNFIKELLAKHDLTYKLIQS